MPIFFLYRNRELVPTDSARARDLDAALDQFPHDGAEHINENSLYFSRGRDEFLLCAQGTMPIWT